MSLEKGTAALKRGVKAGGGKSTEDDAGDMGRAEEQKEERVLEVVDEWTGQDETPFRGVWYVPCTV